MSTSQLIWIAVSLLAGLGGVLALFTSGTVRTYAARTVGAVYRSALEVARLYDDAGLQWLRSPDGVAYRKALISKAYAALPSPIGPVPWKIPVTEARFCGLVEVAFLEMLELAEALLKRDEPTE